MAIAKQACPVCQNEVVRAREGATAYCVTCKTYLEEQKLIYIEPVDQTNKNTESEYEERVWQAYLRLCTKYSHTDRPPISDIKKIAREIVDRYYTEVEGSQEKET